MTIINPNSISGITSITALTNKISFFNSSGTLSGLELDGVNFYSTSGVSTFSSIHIGNDVTIGSGIVTALGGFNIGINSAGTTITSGPLKTLNFIGAGNTFAVNGTTIDISIAGGGGNPTQWVTTATGIHTLSNVGVGTTSPQYTLDVSGDINFTGTFYENGSQFVASRWTAGAGTTIYRDSFVGIGSTQPEYTLDVGGDINFSGNFYQNKSLFVASRWSAGTGTTIYRDSFVGIGTTNPSEKVEISQGNILVTDGAVLTDQNINANVTIGTGKNGLLIGPVTVGVGITIDVASGSTLVIV